MGKVGKILNAADKETAIANGIPLVTVYRVHLVSFPKSLPSMN
jgi:hypothetical protein